MTKCLNQAGRFALIKSSLTPTANHLMQTQALPSHIHKKIDRITTNFFWGHDSSIKKLHPLGRDKLYKPKVRGGLGIRSSKEHNKALLMKRICTFTKSLPPFQPHYIMQNTLNIHPFSKTSLLSRHFPVHNGDNWHRSYQPLNIISSIKLETE